MYVAASDAASFAIAASYKKGEKRHTYGHTLLQKLNWTLLTLNTNTPL